MDYRKINSHIILLAIVIVVGLLVAMVARLMVLGQGVDAVRRILPLSLFSAFVRWCI